MTDTERKLCDNCEYYRPQFDGSEDEWTICYKKFETVIGRIACVEHKKKEIFDSVDES